MAPQVLASLPYDVLDIICSELVSQSQQPDSHNKNTINFNYRPGFEHAEPSAEKMNRNKTAYTARLTCKLFDEILVKYLFRNVHIRLALDLVHINPPLRQLCLEPPGPLQENARCLQISPLYRPRNDSDRHRSFSSYSPTAYEVKIQQQRSRERDQLVAEFKAYLNPAISSFSGVTSVRWDIVASRYDDELMVGFRADIMSALSTIPGLTRLGLMVYNEYHDPTVSVFGKITANMGRMLQLTHLSIQTSLHFVPADYDDFWQFMKTSGIKLASLTVNILSMSLLEYIHGYGGLHSLSFQLARSQGSNTIIHGETAPDVIFSYLFRVALPQHHRSLKNLRLPNMNPDLYNSFQRSFSKSQENPDFHFLTECSLLHSLSFPVVVVYGKMEQAIKDFTQLMACASALPLLDELWLNEHICYGTQRLSRHSPLDLVDTIPQILTIFRYTNYSRLPKYLHIQGGPSYMLKCHLDGKLRYSRIVPARAKATRGV